MKTSAPPVRQHPGYNWTLIVGLTLNFATIIAVVVVMVELL